MRARVVGIGLSLWMLGCGGAGSSAPPPLVAARGREAIATPDAAPERARQTVEVSGLEGTLQAYDVQDTMQRHLQPLAQCQSQHLPRVPHLAGNISMAIHVLTDGKVSQVDVIESDLGDIETEQCIARVVTETRFPKPHGGEADVTWSMILDPASSRGPDVWDAELLDEHLELLLPGTSEACEMTPSTPSFTVTAHVSRAGKVIAAGAAAEARSLGSLMSCVAQDIQTWRLPRGKRAAKVSFEVRYHRSIDDAQKKAIREKHKKRRAAEARRRKREARQQKAEARRHTRSES